MSKKTEIILEVQLIQDGDFVVAYCPELDISSFGRDIDDAFNAFGEMLQLWVQETQELGTFETLLNKAGLLNSNTSLRQSFDNKILESDSSLFYNEMPLSLIETRQKRLEFA
ncbi:MAG: hypothetical protein ABJB16_17370 [Saprospiraceae bacterium]